MGVIVIVTILLFVTFLISFFSGDMKLAVILLSFLILEDLFVYTIEGMDPTKLIKKVKEKAKKETDRNRLWDFVDMITDIAQKGDYDVIKEGCIALKEIAIDQMRDKQMDTTSSSANVDLIVQHLGFIGTEVSKDPDKQYALVEIISAICDVSTTILKDKEVDQLSWLLCNVIRELTEIQKELIGHNLRSNIRNNEVERILLRLYLLVDNTIKTESITKQPTQTFVSDLLELMKDWAIDSKNLPKITPPKKHVMILQSYKTHLIALNYYRVKGYDSIPKGLKDKIKRMLDDTEQLLKDQA